MEQVVVFIQEVGFPIAAAIGLGWFIYKLSQYELLMGWKQS